MENVSVISGTGYDRFTPKLLCMDGLMTALKHGLNVPAVTNNLMRVREVDDRMVDEATHWIVVNNALALLSITRGVTVASIVSAETCGFVKLENLYWHIQDHATFYGQLDGRDKEYLKGATWGDS